MKSYGKKIPLEEKYLKICIAAIENAEYLYANYMIEENFPTDNGRDGAIWNYINKEIKNGLPTDRFQVETLYRGPWKFLGIYDRKTRYLYTFMREKNLSRLRMNVQSNLFHYTNALSKLNEKLSGNYALENQQLSLFPDTMYDEDGHNLLDNVLKSLTYKFAQPIECYVLVAFDISHGIVKDIKGVIPSVGMNYYKEENWTNLLSVSYAENIPEIQENELESPILLERKPKLQRRKRERNSNII